MKNLSFLLVLVCIFAMEVESVEAAKNDINVHGEGIAPAGVSPGDQGIEMLKLTIVLTKGSLTAWQGLVVGLTGSATDSDISSVEVWQDDGDGNWEGAGQDTEIGSSAFVSAVATIEFRADISSSSTHVYFVVYDIAPGANPDHSVGAQLTDADSFLFSNTGVTGNFPIQSGDTSLPVTLSGFTAIPGDGETVLHWTTESEIDNLGFHVYRALAEDGEYERLTAELISGAGNTSVQQVYSFTDIRLTNKITYWYKLEDIAFDGTTTMHGPISVTTQAEEVVEIGALPTELGLSQNAPNPFNSVTEINYQLPDASYAELAIYDMLGQKVQTLASGCLPAGQWSVIWDAHDVASGTYLCVLKVEQQVIFTKKMVLVK